MGLRTPEQYKEALKDGREVYYRGELVPDVTTHPIIGIAVDHACIDYQMAEDPRYRDLAVIKDPSVGDYSRYFHIPRNTEDLLQRSRLIAASTREGATLVVPTTLLQITTSIWKISLMASAFCETVII